MTDFSEYSQSYRSIRLTRSEGVVEMAIHTEGGALLWDYGVPRELTDAFAMVGRDPANKVLIFTGLGEWFSGPPGSASTRPRVSASDWEPLQRNAMSMHTTMLEIPFPVISCINGPAQRHAELPLLADIVLAADTATIHDSGHFVNGTVPGDGMHVILPLLIGWNRAKYHMLTGKPITAAEALDFGIVNEVMHADALLPRARELAKSLAKQSPLVLRYTRLLFTRQVRRMLHDEQGYGLALEGLAAIDLGESVD